MIIGMPAVSTRTGTVSAGKRRCEKPPMRYRLTLWAVVLCASCSSDSRGPLALLGAPSRTMSVAVNQELRIKLQTIGPGEYVSPPAITGSALLFLGAEVVGPYLPGGPTQEFRFNAVTRGQAIIAFHHTQSGPNVSDTVIVR